MANRSSFSKQEFDELRLVLVQTPDALEALIRRLPQPLLEAREGPNTWSPVEVVAHLVSAERTNWITRLRVVFIDADKHFRPFDREAAANEMSRADSSQLLNEFRSLRETNLVTLDRFWAEGRDWSSTALHPELGEVTAQQLLSTWVVHDLGHVAQICRVLAKNWKEDIGPWQTYLSVVHWNGSAGR